LVIYWANSYNFIISFGFAGISLFLKMQCRVFSSFLLFSVFRKFFLLLFTSKHGKSYPYAKMTDDD
jgi:hypothetical protein